MEVCVDESDASFRLLVCVRTTARTGAAIAVVVLNLPDWSRSTPTPVPAEAVYVMKVFIAGATGVLGRRLVERLTDRGHEVHGLARDEDGSELVSARGGEPRRGDVLESSSLETALDSDVDLIVHAATSLPQKMKPSEEDWKRNDQVRLEGAKNLVQAAGSNLDRFVFPSVVMVARQPDGSRFDESADPNPDRATQSAADVEAYLENLSDRKSWDATILRNGLYYAPDASDTRTWAKRLLDDDMPIVGGGLLGRQDAELSLVHADDSARAFADAIDNELTGRYHVVDEESVTGARLFTEFAERLGADDPSRVPAWLARFFVGKVNANAFTSPFPTTNERFKRETGWEPKYPTYRDGLDQVIETWENDGRLTETANGYEWTGE